MNLIETVKASRRTATSIAEDVLTDVLGKSEREVRDKTLAKIAQTPVFFPTGWYDPPPGGVSVLFAEPPYTRLQFDSIRAEEYWSKETAVFQKESSGMFYLSPVDRASGMIGDMGLALYRGDNEAHRAHLRACYEAICAAANLAEVGMSFRDLFAQAMAVFAEHNLTIGWMKTQHDPMQTNLGHTVPGSEGSDLPVHASFDELREAIRTRRVYINAAESFIIPPTCAFTFEARLTDAAKQKPNFFFHVMVTFDEGKKEVLTGFDGIFKAVGMDYML